MKQKSFIIGIGILIVAFALWWISSRRDQPPAVVVRAPSTPRAEEKSIDGAPLPPPQQQSAEGRYDEQVRGAVGLINKQLRFWGKVVDQDGKPLAAVAIKYSARAAYLPQFASIGTKDHYGSTVSREDGSFYIDAGEGDSLGIYELHKLGYRLAQNTKTGFTYAGSPETHRPNPERPVEFVMYQEAAVEQLIHYSHRFDVPPNGVPVAIDLAAGKGSEEGGFRVTLWRDPEKFRRGHPFPWSAKIEVVGGGLLQGDESKPFIAPKEGYQASVEYSFQPKNFDWEAGFEGGIRNMYYVRTADGNYARVQIQLDAELQPPPCWLFMDTWLNPKPGSRNLEYDLAK